jgi:transposase InsO family protein
LPPLGGAINNRFERFTNFKPPALPEVGDFGNFLACFPRLANLHFHVTEHPTAAWTARQLLEVCGLEKVPRYLVRDRDAIYGAEFRRQVVALDMEEIMTAPRSPWQNPYAERVIGSVRRECLDHMIILGERHLKRILGSYAEYYHSVRTHLSLEKDTPHGRPVQSPAQGKIVGRKRVGGLHHECFRMAA